MWTGKSATQEGSTTLHDESDDISVYNRITLNRLGMVIHTLSVVDLDLQRLGSVLR